MPGDFEHTSIDFKLAPVFTGGILIVLLHFNVLVHGQEASGIVQSTYSGINGVRLNPSGLVNSRVYYDINLASGDIFLENNFLFIHQEDFSFMNFLRRDPVLPSAEVPGEGLDYMTGNDLVYGFEQTDLRGPAFSITLGNHAAGFFTRVVTMTSVDRLPGYLGELFFEGLEYEPLHGIPQDHDKFEAAAAGWWEIGLSYAYKFREKRFSHWSAGINVRRLWGYAGAKMISNDAQYTVVNDSVIDIQNLDAGIGFSIPVDYETNDFPAVGSTFRGRGTAFDLGVTFTRKRGVSVNRTYKSYCQHKYEEYLYKIGVSLLDIGGLNFTENVIDQRYEGVSAEWRSVDTVEYQNINQLTRDLSTVFYGDPEAASTGNESFRLGMPAALSIQADYNYFENAHVATMVILPLKIQNSQLRRPAQALLSLRYESDIFEVSLPVSLYDFQKPRIGLSARLYYVTIGTDKLGGFMGFDDFYGMDFYFSVKFHILKGWCGRYKPSPDCRNFSF